MTRQLICLLAAALAVTSNPRATLTASSEPRPGDGVEILVGGAPRARYWHAGRWYVEADKGREYAIQLRNPYGVRVAVALSVDGLNTIDARQTTAAGARKWVLGPYETVTISGWQTSRTEARRFEFTTEERSYGQALGKTTNLGVISAVFYRERAPVIAQMAPEASIGHSARGARAPEASPEEQRAMSDTQKSAERRDEYAATGMGRRTDHVVTQVRLDLEDSPARTVNIRYEFRQQLVQLGILPPAGANGRLGQRERARGFEPGFSPVPPHLR